MIDGAPVEKRKKLTVLVLFSIEPVAGADSDTPRAESISQSARLTVSEGVAKEIVRVLNEHGFEATFANMEDSLDRLRDALVVERPGLVVNRVEEFEGDFNEHAAAMPSVLALMDYAYAGADSACLSMCPNRDRMHLVLAEAGVPTPRFAIIRDINSIPSTDDFDYPVIISQPFDDIYEVEGHDHPLANREALERRAGSLAKDYALPLLIEEYIQGHHVHAIVIGNRVLDVLPLVGTLAEAPEPESVSAPTRPRATTAMEIQAEVFDLLDDSHLDLVQLPHDVADRVRSLAQRAFRAMACRDAAQIDFHVTTAGRPSVINVRPIFDLSRQSAFGVAATSSDRGYENTLVEFVRTACERQKIDPRGELIVPPAPPAQSQPPAQPPKQPQATDAPAPAPADAAPTESAATTESAGSSRTQH